MPYPPSAGRITGEWPRALRPYVRLTAAQVVAVNQLRAMWLQDEQAWFFVNKVDSWEEDQPSTAVDLIRL